MRANISYKEIVDFTTKTRQEKFEAFYMYRPLVEKMIRVSGLPSKSYKDLNDYTQEVFCRLWLYVDDYDIRKSSLPRYLSKITTSIILNTYKELSKKKRKSNDQIVSLSDTETANILETLKPDMPDREVEAYLNNKLIMEKILSDLSIREKDIVVKRFYEEKTMEMIGSELNMTKQRVHQLLTNIVEKFQWNPEIKNIVAV